MRAFSYYEADSWLHRRNPTAKLLAHGILSIALTVVFDPITPLVFLVMAATLGCCLTRFPILSFLRALLPFWILGISLFFGNALFATTIGGTTILWTWGPFTATIRGATIGLSLAERSVAVAAFSLLFLISTNPTDIARSLMQQARVPARIAYPLLAAYRFLPLLHDEYTSLQLARQLRGSQRRGLTGAIRDQVVTLVPLLASAIRKADRVALAMDARGFKTAGTRTHYRDMPFGSGDVLLLCGVLLVTIGLMVGCASLGILHLWAWTLES